MEQKSDPISKIAATIAGAAERIREEQERTGQAWLACYGSIGFVLETQSLNNPDLLRRVDDIKRRVAKLKQRHPDWEIPDEDKADLMSRLDILSENYPPLLEEQ